jgi:hypothetical protein
LDATIGAEKVAEGRERILAELRKVIVGQDEVVEQVLIALFTGGIAISKAEQSTDALCACLARLQRLAPS